MKSIGKEISGKSYINFYDELYFCQYIQTKQNSLIKAIYNQVQLLTFLSSRCQNYSIHSNTVLMISSSFRDKKSLYQFYENFLSKFPLLMVKVRSMRVFVIKNILAIFKLKCVNAAYKNMRFNFPRWLKNDFEQAFCIKDKR